MCTHTLTLTHAHTHTVHQMCSLIAAGLSWELTLVKCLLAELKHKHTAQPLMGLNSHPRGPISEMTLSYAAQTFCFLCTWHRVNENRNFYFTRQTNRESLHMVLVYSPEVRGKYVRSVCFFVHQIRLCSHYKQMWLKYDFFCCHMSVFFCFLFFFYSRVNAVIQLHPLRSRPLSYVVLEPYLSRRCTCDPCENGHVGIHVCFFHTSMVFTTSYVTVLAQITHHVVSQLFIETTEGC